MTSQLSAVGAAIGRPPAADASDEASGIRHQASGDGGCGATGNRQQATGPLVGAAIGRPPEADASDEATGNRQQATDPPVAAHSVCRAAPSSDEEFSKN